MVKSAISLVSSSPPAGSGRGQSSSSAASLASPSKPGDLASMASQSQRSVQCVNCEETELMIDCCAWSGNKLSCKRCKTNYNRQNERGRKELVWKKWFAALSSTEKVAWYKSQKAHIGTYRSTYLPLAIYFCVVLSFCLSIFLCVFMSVALS